MNAQMKAIKACDSLDALAALVPTLGDDVALLEFAADHERVLVELECFGPAPATAASEASTASNDEEEYVPSERKVAAVKAAIASVESKAAPVVSTTVASTGAPAVVGAVGPVASKASVTPTDRPLRMAGFPHPKMKVGKDGETIITGLMNTIQNLECMLAGYGITCRYNEMTRLREIDFPGLVSSADNKDEVTVNEILNLTVINNLTFSLDRLSGALSNIAERDCYHPAREWIVSQAWDGASRFEALADTLAVASDEYAVHRNAVLRRWLISAVAALFSTNPNDKFELALTFQGFQGKGKTTWFKRLAEPKLNAVLDGLNLNPHNKDCVFTFAGHWIAELGELDTTFSKSELGAIKAFMSKSRDSLRRPYAHFDSIMKRQTVLGATVNRSDFLIDETGNRRFPTIPLIGVDHQHDIDMQQLWAEVKTWYDAGEQWWLTDAEADRVATVNKRFEAVQPVAEMLVDAFNFTEPARDIFGVLVEPERKTVRITATQVCILFGLPKDRKTAGEAGSALRKLTGQEPKPYGGASVWKVTPNPRSTYSAQVKVLLGIAD